MKKSRIRTARDWLLYAAARFTMGLLQALPWARGRAAAGWLGRLAYMLDRRERKENSLDNLMRAFPDMDRPRAVALLRRVYEHLVGSVLDSMNFVRVAGNWPTEKLLDVEGIEKLDGLEYDTGAILVTGHFGHWELLGAAGPLIGHAAHSVMRGLRNVFADRYVRRLRGATGQRLLDKHGDLRQMLRLLKQGEDVAILIDQDARKHGVFVEFFGRPASTTQAPARIALQTGAPIAFMYARRYPGQSRFRLVLTDVIRPQLTADRDAEVLRITQRLTSDLEEVIRQVPHEWLWVHRRWKTYPGKYASQTMPRQGAGADEQLTVRQDGQK